MQRPQVSGPLIIAIEVGTHVVRPWNVWKFLVTDVYGCMELRGLCAGCSKTAENFPYILFTQNTAERTAVATAAVAKQDEFESGLFRGFFRKGIFVATFRPGFYLIKKIQSVEKK